MFKKLKIMYKDIIYVSRITKTKNKKLRIILTVILSNLVAATDIGLILIFSAVIADQFQSDNVLSFLVELFLNNTFLVPVLVVMRYVFTYAQSINQKLLELEINRNLKVHLLEEVFDKSNYSISDAYFYVNELTAHITFFYGAITSFLMSSIQVLAYSYYLYRSDPLTILYFFGGVIVLYLPLKKIISRSRKYTDETYWKTLTVSKEIEKIVENMFLIKILKKDKLEIQKFNNLLSDLNNIGLRHTIWNSLSGFLPTFLTLFVLGVLISFKNVVEKLTLDFIGVTLRLFQQLGAISNSFNNLLNSQIHIKHFSNVEKNKISVNRENYSNELLDDSELAVDIQNVSFKYFNSDDYIFKDIKSTLLGLIAGVLLAEEGKIITSSPRFGYIGATPFIFNDTLRNNLVYGNDIKILDELLIKKLNEFDVFKEQSSYDLDRVISNKSLSSGQMQKIAFIRALISGIDILLLDESTSNLDVKTKDFIFEILSKEKVTIINSTHDPSIFKDSTNHIKIELVDEERKLIFN
jgi:ABC-type multidrug transport system fused ATPase/permease subunit